MAVKQKAEEEAQARLAAEKKAAEDREAKARADAESESRRRQEADQARIQAEQAKADAERMKLEAQQPLRKPRSRKPKRNRPLSKPPNKRPKPSRLAKPRSTSNTPPKLKRKKLCRPLPIAENEKAQLRAQLLEQLNSILQTRDSARGLIVNMSDVLFDTGSTTLKPGAREKLAKISGILLAHKGLILQIEGHTDSVGTD